MIKSSDIILYADNTNQILLKPITSLYEKRVLNEDVEESIVEQASLLPHRIPITLTVYLPASVSYKEEEIVAAVHRHFAFLEKKSKTQIKQVLQHGGRSLIIGFAFLTFMVLLSEAGKSFFSIGGLAVTIREALVILGWVGLWRPAELLLYDWYPFKRDANLFDRLKRSQVQIITGNNTGSI